MPKHEILKFTDMIFKIKFFSMQEATSALESARSEISRLEESLAALKIDLEGAKADADGQRKARVAAEAQVSSAQKDIAAKEAECKSLHDKIKCEYSP